MSAMISRPSSSHSLWKSLILALALLLNVTLIWCLVWGAQSFLVYSDLRQRHDELAQEVEQYNAVNAALSQEIRLLQTDANYVEKAIRQRLNFVRDNEVLYLFEEQDSQGATANDGKN